MRRALLVVRAMLVVALPLAAACKDKQPSAPPSAPAAAPDAKALYAQGKVALDDNRLAEAVKMFTQATALASDPELKANSWLALGAAYAQRGDNTHAVAAWEQVTVLRPEDADAWRVLAEGLSSIGQRERQALALAHVIAIDPDDLASYLELAGVYTSLNKPDEAKDVYVRYENRRRETVLQLGKSKDPTARAAAAEVLGDARDASTARALVLALTDKDPGVRAACARSLGKIGLDVDPEIRPALNLLLQREKDDKVRAAIEAAFNPAPEK